MTKPEVLHSLFTINYSAKMEMKLRESIGGGVPLSLIKSSIEGDICAPQLMNLISQIAPICYKIGDKVFLKGETKGNHDFVGDELDYQPVTELFDMTTEMKTGDSYSFYVSDTSFFPFATPAEIIEVKKFLDNLHK